MVDEHTALRTRDRAARVRERAGDVSGFLVHVARLLGRVATDDRVPRSAKLVAAGAAAYALSPLDLVPDVVPVVGQLDDLWLLSRALRHLVRRAGYELLREHWDGTDEQFFAVLVVAGVAE